jgi:hypothetical protein
MDILDKIRPAGPLRGKSRAEMLDALRRGEARIDRGILVPRITGAAAAPAFAATPNRGFHLISATLDTSLTAPTNGVTIFTAGASGSKVDQITVQGVGTTVAAVCNIFVYNAVTYALIDQFLITAITSSTTAVAYQAIHTYENMILDATETLVATQTVAGNQSLLMVTAQGGDF